jgi:hypothetical protein
VVDGAGRHHDDGADYVRFNLQTYLAEMRAEQQAAHHRLAGQVQLGFNKMDERTMLISNTLKDHTAADAQATQELDDRLNRLEAVNKFGRWLGAGIITSLLLAVATFVVDLLRNHFH